MCQEENTHVRGGCAKGWVTPGAGAAWGPEHPPPQTGMEQTTPLHRSTELLTKIKHST